MIDTADPDAKVSFHESNENYQLAGRSLSLFRLRDKQEEAGKVLSAKQTERLAKISTAV